MTAIARGPIKGGGALAYGPIKQPRVFRYRWVCEFCFRVIHNKDLPATWDLIWQSAVCPKCQSKVAADGGYNIVKGGAYAGKRTDPRAA